jgi:hypothetical protein
LRFARYVPAASEEQRFAARARPHDAHTVRAIGGTHGNGQATLCAECAGMRH